MNEKKIGEAKKGRGRVRRTLNRIISMLNHWNSIKIRQKGTKHIPKIIAINSHDFKNQIKPSPQRKSESRRTHARPRTHALTHQPKNQPTPTTLTQSHVPCPTGQAVLVWNSKIPEFQDSRDSRIPEFQGFQDSLEKNPTIIYKRISHGRRKILEKNPSKKKRKKKRKKEKNAKNPKIMKKTLDMLPCMNYIDSMKRPDSFQFTQKKEEKNHEKIQDWNQM